MNENFEYDMRSEQCAADFEKIREKYESGHLLNFLITVSLISQFQIATVKFNAIRSMFMSYDDDCERFIPRYDAQILIAEMEEILKQLFTYVIQN